MVVRPKAEGLTRPDKREIGVFKSPTSASTHRLHDERSGDVDRDALERILDHHPTTDLD